MDTEETPITDRTRSILAAIADMKAEQQQHTQDVTTEVREIKAILQKQESRFTALRRAIKHFLGLTE